MQTTSSEHIATRSMPTVSSRSDIRAISSLVPTPSVAAASIRPSLIRNNPAIPPTSSATSGRLARAARSAISVTAFAAASVSTPARRYASLIARSRGRELQLLFQHELPGSLRDRDRILAVEARAAEVILRRTRRPDQPVERQVAQRVG